MLWCASRKSRHFDISCSAISGSPHVRMVDLSNADEVKNVVKEIIEQPPVSNV